MPSVEKALPMRFFAAAGMRAIGPPFLPPMLDAACLRYQNDDIVVLPTYGWGWRVAAGCVDYAPIDAAEAFKVRVCRFFRFRGELRGVVGVVTEKAHLFSGLRVVAAEMIVGDHDFTDRLCHRFDLALGTELPSDDEWPSFSDRGLRYEGHGILAANRSCIEAFVARRRATLHHR